MSFGDLRSFLRELKSQRDLVEVEVEVDPYLEIAEIHRRVIAQGGPALYFKHVRGSRYPVVTNLFGTPERVRLALGPEPESMIAYVEKFILGRIRVGPRSIWKERKHLWRILNTGVKRSRSLGKGWRITTPPDLYELPALTTWPEDGGPFLTLPLVYTEHPDSGRHNLGIYRMQLFDARTTGMHFQIAKGGGYHLDAARKLGLSMPTNVFLGGSPALILAAIAPLPENVPELLLASLLMGRKVGLTSNPLGPLPLLNAAEFVISGFIVPNERHLEGPFGDHYGYYSKTHEFPVFRADALFAREDAVFPATVVGKPKQEDFFLADYIQELFSPLVPHLMPQVRSLWSYGESGYHPLAAAVVRERFHREALGAAFRILGEGQLGLTKFLIIVDQTMDLRNFPSVLAYALARFDPSCDFYVFSNTSMDTLDYCGPKLNEGSKALLIGTGEAKRDLPSEFADEAPESSSHLKVFCPGCIVVSGPSYGEIPDWGSRLGRCEQFAKWPLVVLADDAERTGRSTGDFLWTTFTRFEPASDIFSPRVDTTRFHPAVSLPLVVDARTKPRYPREVFCDEQTSALVDKRWKSYFR